jgi:AcrR family transcriptional regulator
LLGAFTELQREKTFSAISVQDITERATVNRATFYSHFEDKYALMDCWIREEFRRTLAPRLLGHSTLSVEALRVLIRAVFDFLGGFYSRCRRADTQFEPMFETAMQEELVVVLLGWLEERQRAGVGTRDKPESTAQIVSWAIFGPAVQWSRGDRTRPAEAMAEDVLGVVAAALASVAGTIPSSQARR